MPTKQKDFTLPFPLKGVNRNIAIGTQPSLTSVDMLNVRPLDVLENRIRGGQRPGLKKQFSDCIGDSKPVVIIDQVTVVEVS
ncbi:MAG: hypothetical protein JW912_07575 [Sedimentisphaerales bacterium]|nr:hypothetical protein [Sedimentisphaerales bacterium]